mmetsp:Transcript_107881/g.348208  ORF Transcript_107881/g.348208 Transcript_107881/m.348208 type:complete len:314 (-) Transcript_107881:514-1455(-)
MRRRASRSWRCQAESELGVRAVSELGARLKDPQVNERRHDAPWGQHDAGVERVLQLVLPAIAIKACECTLLLQGLLDLPLHVLVERLVLLCGEEAEVHGVPHGHLDVVPRDPHAEVRLRLQEAEEAHVWGEALEGHVEQLGRLHVPLPREGREDVVGLPGGRRVQRGVRHHALADPRDPAAGRGLLALFRHRRVLIRELRHQQRLQVVGREVQEPHRGDLEVLPDEALDVQAGGRLGPAILVVVPAVQRVLGGLLLVPDVAREGRDVADDALEDLLVLVQEPALRLRLREHEDALQLPRQRGHEVLDVLVEEA